MPAEEVALGYQQSQSIVAYLVNRYGFWRIRRLLKSIATGKSLEIALNEELRVKSPILEKYWTDWLAEFLKKH